jgi:hypothetical protein
MSLLKNIRFYVLAVSIFLAFLGVLIPIKSVFAHQSGQQSFFQINDKHPNPYAVTSTSLNVFNLPEDLAAENYLVNQSLEMEMEPALLPVLPEIVNKTNFIWDFGDGFKGTDLKNTHTYQKMGSYILTIQAQYGADQPQIIQSVLINILPDANYQIPIYRISVNGQESKDPLVDVIKLKFGSEFEFKGVVVNKPTSQVRSYFWDFGDQQSSQEKEPKHSYNQDLGQVFPILRVIDNNGFISDSFVEIENSKLTADSVINKIAPSKTSGKQPSKWVLLGGGVVALLLLYLAWFMVKRFKRG